MFRGAHEPGSRFVRNARLGPLFERSNQGILSELLREADVAHDSRESRDQPGGLDPPDRVNRAMRIGRRRVYCLAAACERTRSSRFLASGVKLAPKSSASHTWRISDSPFSPVGWGMRLTHSIASSIDLTCHSQKPAISSLVSANGPSTTVRLLPPNLTRAPFELG